jgi:hypothetical protein
MKVLEQILISYNVPMKNYKKYLMKTHISKYIIGYLIILLVSCKANKEQVKVGGKATILFEKDTLNFGILHKDSVFEGEYAYTNMGDDTLKVVRVKGQCGCTEGYTLNKFVLPAQKGYIHIEYKPNPQDSGLVFKKVLLETNTDTIFRTFYLKGIVRK